ARVRAKRHAQCLVVALACEGCEGFDERLIRDAGRARRIAMADECESAPRADEARQLVAHGSLADARLADEHNQPAVAADRGLERALEVPQLTLAADKRLPIGEELRGPPTPVGLIRSLWTCVRSHGRCGAL